MTWFRKQASDPNLKLSYKVLFYQGQAAPSLFSNPKGRPSKNAPIPTPAQVAEHMIVNDVLCGPNIDGHNQVEHQGDNEIEEGLVSVYSVSPVAPSTVAEVTVHPANKEIEEKLDMSPSMQTLIDQSMQRLHLLKAPWLTKTKVMVGASWMDQAAYRLFLRFPEVLFIDSTHKTNNEGRPLLQICAKDSDAKAFTILRVLMPNETHAFYRWVFLEVLPKMLGEANLHKVVLVLTDGDSQEFCALEKAIFKFMPKAVRGRCGYHLIEKSFEKYGPSFKELHNEPMAEPLFQQ